MTILVWMIINTPIVMAGKVNKTILQILTSLQSLPSQVSWNSWMSRSGVASLWDADAFYACGKHWCSRWQHLHVITVCARWVCSVSDLQSIYRQLYMFPSGIFEANSYQYFTAYFSYINLSDSLHTYGNGNQHLQSILY